MRMSYKVSPFAAVAVLLASAGAASAHAHLTASNPAAGATVAAPGSISLTFSERVVPAFSSFELVNAAGVATAVRTTVSRDGRSVAGRPAHPLTAGRYSVNWHAASSDGHRMTGSLAFTVR